LATPANPIFFMFQKALNEFQVSYSFECDSDPVRYYKQAEVNCF